MSLRGLIPCVPAPNHLKLVNDAYPSSKQVIEPDSNGLGKLTFYTKSRPIKLAKVADALLKRSQRSSEPVNSLCVTLTILKKLLEECRHDVNVFSEQTVVIISIAVKRRSTEANAQELLEKAAGTFYALVTFTKLAALDERSYMALLADFGNLAKDAHSMQYRLVGLHALQGVAESEILYASDFRKQIEYIVPTLLDDIIDSDITADELDQMLRSEKAGHQDALHSPSGHRPINDRRARSIRIAKGMEGTEKPPSSREVGQQACKTLQIILRCSSHNQLEQVLTTLLEYVDNKNPKLWQNTGWFTWLAEKCLEWTQPQHRSVHVQFWLGQLTALNGGASSKSAAKHEAILAVVTSLLSTSTAVVTPTISDTLASLSALVVRQPRQRGLVDAIVALASHTYYPEQLNDMTADLLKDATEVYTAGRRHSTTVTPALVALLTCVQEILHQAKNARFNTICPSHDQLCDTLVIFDSENSTERTAYLAAMQAVIETSPVDANFNNLHGKTASSLPSIFVGVPDKGQGAALSPIARFARDLQLRLRTNLKTDLPKDELRQLEDVLRALYRRREANIVLEGIPIWLALSESSRTQGQSLASVVLQDTMTTWECSSDPSTTDIAIASICGSRSLQEAAGLSAEELHERLTRSLAVTSPVSASMTEIPSKRASSVRNSAAYRQRNAASEHGGRSRASSIPSTSLADLKQSLASGQFSNGHSNPAIPSRLQHEQQSGFSSPSRSVGARTSVASSIRSSVNGHMAGSRFGNTTPPPAEVNGQDHHIQMRSGSPSDAISPVSRTSSRKPRLERILGSANDENGLKAVFSSNRVGSVPHKFISPPYQ